jgi:NAD(P)-dependent dehydrogenase (short-subunit alcohol dehydrogenase family)
MSEIVALVTGANRGIGFEICRQLAKLGIRTVLTSRDQQKGNEATKILQKEGLPVTFCDLDVTDEVSVADAKVFVQRAYDRLDILINNAGIYPDDGISALKLDIKTLRETIEVNTLGMFAMCKAMIPLMIEQKYGRIVNLSSGYGNIHEMSGYSVAYKISKASVNAMTRVFADELRAYPNIKVNAMDPGWVNTDMGGKHAPRTPEQAAQTAIYLATLDDDGVTDGYFYDKQQLAW